MIDILKSGNIWAGFIKYYYIFEVSFKNSIIYLWDVLFGNAFLIIIVFIMSQIWFAAYSYNGKPTIEGFTIYQMVWYIFVTEVIYTSSPKIIEDISRQIKDGTVSMVIARPYSFVFYNLAVFFGDSIVRVFSKLIVGGIIMTIFIGHIPLDPMYLLLVLIPILLSIILNFFMMYLLGNLAFYYEDAYSMRFIYGKSLFVLGGLFFPISLYPEWARMIIGYLPFEKVLFLPADLFVQFSMDKFYTLISSQLLWIAIFFVLTLVVFNSVVKKLATNGG